MYSTARHSRQGTSVKKAEASGSPYRYAPVDELSFPGHWLFDSLKRSSRNALGFIET